MERVINLVKEPKKFLVIASIIMFVFGVSVFAYSLAKRIAISFWAGKIDSSKHLAQIEELIGEYAKAASELNENGLFFVPTPKPKSPMITGILGESALVNGKWCRVGDEHCGAKILKIAPAFVEIEWDGKKKKISPMQFDLSKKEPEKKKKKESDKAKVATQETQTPKEIVGEVAQSQPQEDPFSWMGNISPKLKKHLARLYGVMNDQMKQQFKQQWESASESDREEGLLELEEAIDSGEFDQMVEQMESMQ